MKEDQEVTNTRLEYEKWSEICENKQHSLAGVVGYIALFEFIWLLLYSYILAPAIGKVISAELSVLLFMVSCFILGFMVHGQCHTTNEIYHRCKNKAEEAYNDAKRRHSK